MKTVTLLIACASLFGQTTPAPPKPAPAKPAAPKPAGAAGQKTAFDKATLEAYLRNVELWIPTVSVKIDDPKPSTAIPDFSDVWVHAEYNGAQKDALYYVSKDGHRVIKGSIYDINKSPFQGNLDKLKADQEPSYGPANAPVSLVVFSDFECPICKEEANVLRQNVSATFPKEVRVGFEDFPLDTIHPWARMASIAGRCIARQNPPKFWDYFDWIYENQAQITIENLGSKIQEFATAKGVDGMQLGRCLDAKTAEADVNRSVGVGRSLMVEATPTIFINGRKMEGGLPWQSLEQLIRIELDRQAKAAEAAKADDCCVVTLPKLVK